MTYICGINWSGTNFIICDTRLTLMNKPDDESVIDMAVKSGVLFPGCIFARSGDLINSGRFLEFAQKRVEQDASLSEKWDIFCDFVDEYPFPKKGDFSILISTRAQGVPKFFIIDSSKHGIFPCHQQIVNLGSGKRYLEPLVEEEIQHIKNFTVE